MGIRWVPPVVLVAAGLFPAAIALAVPPPGAAMGVTNLPQDRQERVTSAPIAGSPAALEYRVARGDQLGSIASRHGVSVADLIRWNDLDPVKQVVREGQLLRIVAPADGGQRRRRQYLVRPGDTWAKIAQRFGVPEEKLRRHWNPGQDELRAGDRLNLWVVPAAGARPQPAVALSSAATDANLRAAVEQPLLVSAVTRSYPEVPVRGAMPDPTPEPVEAKRFRIISVPPTAMSIGTPNRGRLKNGIQLPVNDELYTIRNPDHAWCSSHLIEYLQRAIASFRERTGFDRQILIWDTSRRGGGALRPHVSHRQGRDVDIQLPTRKGVPARAIPTKMGMVDWDATWELVKSFAATGSVKYIFLSRSRQVELYRAAKRSGASEDEIRQYLQYPRGVPDALVRDSRGHVKHFHVRFKCAPYETECQD